MRHLIIIVLLICLGIGGHYLSPAETIRVCGSLGETTEIVLGSHDVTMLKKAGKTSILVSDREIVLEALIEALYCCRLRRNITEQNIANARTTKSAEGTPYRRQSLSVEQDGSLIVEQDMSNFFWMYDPSHPDAMREGPKSGYLALPNVNRDQEKAELLVIAREENLVRELICRLDPDLILPEQPVFDSLQKPKLGDRKQSEVWVDFKPKFRTLGKFSTQKSDNHYRSVQPLAQSNSVSCGQTSVAVCINALTGTDLTDADIDEHYGFQLLEALKNECRPAGYDWSDAGNISEGNKALIVEKLGERLPVIVALNGPDFSPSGTGAIVTLVSSNDDTFCYAAPATGQFETTTWEALVGAPSHPDGNFIFVPRKMKCSSSVSPIPTRLKNLL